MDQQGSLNKSKEIFVPLFIALLSFAVYLPALKNGFVTWDDGMYIYKNPSLLPVSFQYVKWSFGSFAAGNWHPLTWISYGIDNALWNLDPFGYHLVNVLLHALNAVLVYFLAVRLIGKGIEGEGQRTVTDDRRDRWFVLIAATATGVLFGVHPVHVESVAWVSERKDVLYSLFFISGMLSYIAYCREHGGQAGNQGVPALRGYYVLTVIFFLLSLLSKPMAITFPFVLLVLDWYPLRRMHDKATTKLILEKTPFFLMCLISGVMTLKAQSLGGSVQSFDTVPFLTRIMNVCRSLVLYISKIIVPVNLSPYYPYPPGSSGMININTLLYVVITGLIVVIVVRSLKKSRLWAALFAYFIVTLLPVLGLVQTGGQAMADRYMYLPSLSLFILAGLCTAGLMMWSFRGGVLRRSGVALIIVLVTAGLSCATIAQISVWKSGETLWDRVVALNPDLPYAYNNRGIYYHEETRFEEAIQDFDKGIAIDPGNVMLYINRAYSKIKLDRFDDALQDISMAVSIAPDSWKVYYIRGKLFAASGKNEEAMKDYSRVIELNPSMADVYNNRANVLVRMGHFADAIKDYTKALELSGARNPDIFRNRATVYTMMGRTVEAQKDLEMVRRLKNK